MGPRVLFTLTAALAAAAVFWPRGTHADQPADRAKQNGSCAGCHPDIAAEWQRSLHQHAWKDPVFQEAYQVEPLPFCRGCHAPESDPAREPTAKAQDVGVGCVTCHLMNDGVHGTKASPKAEHAVIADARLATPTFCGRCHQFDFPAGANQVHPQPMQDTVAEHAASSKKDTPCQSCHMPVVDGPDGKHRSHAFSVIADQAMIKKAVTVVAERSDASGATTVKLTLTAAEIGHAFPTGDMFRRVEVRAVALDAKGRTIATAEPVALQRRFEDHPRDASADDLMFSRVEAEDSRVPPPGLGARTVALALPRAARARVVWSVVYQRMSTPMASAFGVEQVLDEIVVAKGELPPRAFAHLTHVAHNRTGGPR
jgi:hypothetical protein